jgi:hypothetical protein
MPIYHQGNINRTLTPVNLTFQCNAFSPDQKKKEKKKCRKREVGGKYIYPTEEGAERGKTLAKKKKIKA